MRNYWFKILLGALGVFAVGMIGVTVVRGGIAKVHSVVEGDGPITIPLGLVPFALAGERLGKLDHVTLHRETPTRVSEVELSVNLEDSLFAKGLSGCRLVANIEGDDKQERGVNIRVGRNGVDRNAFSCLSGDSTPAEFVEYGTATFNPGEVEVPLLLPVNLVTELQSLDFGHDSAAGDSLGEINVPTDSIAAQVERELDSAMVRRRPGESRQQATRRFADSIRAEAMKRLAEEADPQ
jgi:hypothetical protein